jgi:hypothetical protein
MLFGVCELYDPLLKEGNPSSDFAAVEQITLMLLNADKFVRTRINGKGG